MSRKPNRHRANHLLPLFLLSLLCLHSLNINIYAIDRERTRTANLIIDDFHVIIPSEQTASVQLFELNAAVTIITELYEDLISAPNDYKTANIVDGFYITVDETTGGSPTFTKIAVTVSSATMSNQLQITNFARKYAYWLLPVPSSTRFIAIAASNDTIISYKNIVILETNPTLSLVSTIDVGNSSFFREFAEIMGGTTLVANGRDSI